MFEGKKLKPKTNGLTKIQKRSLRSTKEKKSFWKNKTCKTMPTAAEKKKIFRMDSICGIVA